VHHLFVVLLRIRCAHSLPVRTREPSTHNSDLDTSHIPQDARLTLCTPSLTNVLKHTRRVAVNNSMFVSPHNAAMSWQFTRLCSPLYHPIPNCPEVHVQSKTTAFHAHTTRLKDTRRRLSAFAMFVSSTVRIRRHSLPHSSLIASRTVLCCAC